MRPAPTRRALAAVGISDQRETTVVWDRHTGRPAHNAIVWQDTRTAEAGQRLAAAGEGGADRFRAITGLPISTYSSGLKLAWILDALGADAPGRRRAAATSCFGTIDTWLIWKLTGGVRRRRPRDRRHERVADDAHGPRAPRVGRGDPRRAGASRRRCSPRSAARPRSTARGPATSRASRSPATSATSRRRSSARPASTRARSSAPTGPAASC